jgi:lipopolysaccharide assembly outer membrane protein LptD (OstA)
MNVFSVSGLSALRNLLMVSPTTPMHASLKFFASHLTLLTLLIIQSNSFAMVARGQKLELIRADEIQSFNRGGITYRRLVGDVKMRRGDALLTCDVAEFQMEKDEALLSGHVTITTPESKLSSNTARYAGSKEYVELLGDARFEDNPFIVTAEKLGYYIDLKKVLATDNPALEDSGSTLRADTIYYYEKNQLGDARGRASMVNTTDSLSVSGKHMLYYSGKDSLLSFGDAQFKKWSAIDTSLQIDSDSLSLEEGYFFAWKNVQLRNGNALGTCGQAVYMQEDDVAIMRDRPMLQEEDFVLTGDVFNLHMDNGGLKSVYVPENPHFTQRKASRDTTFSDWLDGKVMAVEFDEGQPQTVTLIEMATSFFNVIEDGIFKGSNKVSGDTLFILLSDSSISDITVTGGAEGEFDPAQGSRDIEFPIKYWAEHIAYSMQNETTQLKSNASIEYGDMKLKAGHIGVYWRQNLLRARSLVDTLGSKDYPVLSQKGQEDFNGQSMIYDLKTQRGKVVAGRTKMDDGNYYGEELTRIDEDIYLMEDGYYTTCDVEDHPHFYFYSRQMKLYTDKIIIAKPVVLYIADIPLMALPFAVFPQKKGRSSGFILPSYDYRPRNGGRALKGFGYYWAINDYSDFKMTGTFWDQYEEFNLRSVLRYKMRYKISGSVDASMVSDRNALDDPMNWKWRLKFNHSQTIDPSFTIRADGELSGDANFDRNYSHDQDERLNTKLHSGISINKKFESINSTTSLSGTYDENLQVTRRVEEAPKSAGIKLAGPTLALPSFRFSRASSPIIKAKGNKEYWYNSFRWSYNNAFSNRRKWSYLSYENPDTLARDSLLWQEDIVDTRTWNHNMSLSGDTQVLKVLKMVGSISYKDAWGFKYLNPVEDENGRAFVDTGTGRIVTEELEGFIRRGTFSTSVSLNTKMYGIFPVHIGALQAIRHTLTPSISLTHTPDFSTDFWGYTKLLTDTTGAEQRFDRFAGSDLGATPNKESLRMSYSLSNVFDYKLFRDEEVSKAQFLTWGVSGSYNFSADSLKASDISSNIKINVGKSFRLSPSMTYEIYERDSTGSHKINQFRAPRMTRASFSFGFQLQGDAPGGLRSSVRKESVPDSLSADTADSFNQPFDFGELQAPMTRSGRNTPAWSANFSFSYTFSHQNPLEDTKQTFNLGTNLKFNLSENWAVNYNPRFDLMEKKLVSGSVGVTRNLHCWKMTLSWTPMGRWGGLNLTIRPKASQLQDLKVEHTSRRKY